MKNAYLRPDRLSDVIAGITTLGTYKFYKLDFKSWSDRICGDEDREKHWEAILREHPEFFRVDRGGKNASLIWRRQFPKTYHVDQRIDLPLPNGERHHEDGERLSRRPLEPAEITALINVATNLHDRALEQHKARRWWIPLFTGILALIGAVIGGWLSSGAS
ncbi:hypothetical protein [Hyphomonas sp. KY3]|uniref:hypothetical protein n=1 Tax=Hyphomonas sp. KY3 TaxID=2016196 RepID=UPI001A8FB31F|nr:hypothetical protein [Hyphomonas sp. KY3]QSR23179.1 N-carbamoyl-L-amino acid amidohydrolase [Hyphomonas sp. KY3]